MNGDINYKLSGHTGAVRCIAASPEGTEIFSSGDDCAIHHWRIWDQGVTMGRLYLGHTSVVTCLLILEEDIVISGSVDTTLRLWDSHTGSCCGTLIGHTGPIFCMTRMQDGLVLTAGGDAVLRVWDLNTRSLIQSINGPEHAVTSVAKVQENIVAAGEDVTWIIKIYDISRPTILQLLHGHNGPVRDIKVGVNEMMVTISEDKTIRIWTWKEEYYMRNTVITVDSPLYSLLILPNGNFITAGGKRNVSGDIFVWSQVNDYKTPVTSLVGHDSIVHCMALTKNFNVLSGSEDQTMRMWVNTHRGYSSDLPLRDVQDQTSASCSIQ